MTTKVKIYILLTIFTGILVVANQPTEEERQLSVQKEKQVKEEKIKQLELEAKKIPETDYQDNYFAYKRLLEENPKNKKYLDKVNYYKVRYDLSENIAKSCRIEARKRNKASLNNPETYDTVDYFDKWAQGAYFYEEVFKGKNSFGVPSKLVSQYKCTMNKNSVLSITRVFIKKSN